MVVGGRIFFLGLALGAPGAGAGLQLCAPGAGAAPSVGRTMTPARALVGAHVPHRERERERAPKGHVEGKTKKDTNNDAGLLFLLLLLLFYN